ncbi:MAG: CRISPR-associated endonuclease Cas2 [Crenarchaeota archaeon]|nr:CRISPR-associated endonuclease Cas2 [Thermoproteota archaeon]
MYVAIVYDISDDRKRKKYSDYLKSRGFVRVQRSMFMGRPVSSIYKDVLRRSKTVISGEDIVHIIPLTKYSIDYMVVLGNPLSRIKGENIVVLSI